jgi:Tol biopolymer transport system component
VELPPPPSRQDTPWDRGQRLLTPLTGALTLLAIYVIAAYFAYLVLLAFPTPYAFWSLVLLIPLAAAVGAWVGSIDRGEPRRKATLVACVAAIAVPFALVAWVPGIAQPQQQALPGGTDVVIAAAPDGNPDLYLSPDGDPDRTIELTQTALASERFPELAPDGRSLVYAVDGPDGSTDLRLMTLDDQGRPVGSELLLDGPGNLSETSWSPDGSELLVRSDTEDEGTLYRYVFATEELQPFLRNAFNPAWSPDGRQVAFAGTDPDDPANVDVFVADADGSRRRLVVDTGYDDFFPVWSPQGDRLAFASEFHGGDLDVFVVGLDGSRLTILTADHDGYDEPIMWTPERDILFISDRAEIGGVFGYLMEPDGSNVRLFIRL